MTFKNCVAASACTSLHLYTGCLLAIGPSNDSLMWIGRSSWTSSLYRGSVGK
uniref:Uncharacterized protein n=1 Tax=Rhizophora mucronata TaxID=61149 RepID=A0A2P2QTZ7_RHIMU